jgi:predicted MFS family arabinose efflux permease
MQIVAYGAGGLLLVVLPPSGLFVVAATCSALAAVLYRFRLPDRPARASGPVFRRTREVNRRMLGSRVLRPLYLSSWVPNGLIVGCEALFIPYAGQQAGYLLAATAAGMLAGDIVVGRFLPHHVRDRLVNPLRFLLAAPFLAFWLQPTIGVAMALGLVAAFGYADSLPLQERMVAHTPDDAMGQMLGLRAAGLGAGQAVGALLAGTTADLLGVGPEAAGRAMAVMAALSILVSLALVPGLRRSRTTLSGSARVSPAPPVTPHGQRPGGAPSGGAPGRPRSSGRPG